MFMAPVTNAGSNVASLAVFDVDETLIRIKSMFEFLTFALQQREGHATGTKLAQERVADLRKMAQTQRREDVNREFYRTFQGWTVTDVSDLAEQWFASINSDALYHSEVLRRYLAHQRLGHTTVFLSGSASLFLAPLADHLRVDCLLAINMAARNGVLTGEIQGIQTIGTGKRDALYQLLGPLKHQTKIFGYGDHASDLPFLEICDHASAIVSDGSASNPDAWHHPLSKIVVT